MFKFFNSLYIYKRLIPFISPYIFRLVIGLICGLLNGITSFGIIVLLKSILGTVSNDEENYLSNLSYINDVSGFAGDVEIYRVISTVILLPLITIIQGLLLFIAGYYVTWVGSKVVTDVRNKMYKHIHSLPINYFYKNRSGELISRISGDTSSLMNLVGNVISDLITAPFVLLGSVSAMVYLDWKLSIITLIIFPFCMLPVALVGKRIRSASMDSMKCAADMLSHAQEGIGGASVVKAFQNEDREVNLFAQSNLKVFKFSMRQLRASAIINPLIHFVSAIGISLIVLFSYFNNMSLALLMSFVVAVVQMYKPFKKLTQIHLKIQASIPGVERIFEVLDFDNNIYDSEDAEELANVVNQISFNNVSFAYEKKHVLKNINLEVRKGMRIALVGSSGAGKSTLVNLIPRFYDISEGEILINGKNIKNYTIKSLRKKIGIVTQETILFNRTVRENIAYGLSNISDEEIIIAAKRANAHSFIDNLEQKYDTIIGEKGSFLSGGMSQRLTIARALLKNSPILILDEATSALDNESEQLVQTAIDELMIDRTVFVIAHRLSTIKNADIILVMDNGRIIETGTHDELINKSGKYKYFYEMQFKKKLK